MNKILMRLSFATRRAPSVAALITLQCILMATVFVSAAAAIFLQTPLTVLSVTLRLAETILAQALRGLEEVELRMASAVGLLKARLRL